jgi:hypothetical protein
MSAALRTGGNGAAAANCIGAAAEIGAGADDPRWSGGAASRIISGPEASAIIVAL